MTTKPVVYLSDKNDIWQQKSGLAGTVPGPRGRIRTHGIGHPSVLGFAVAKKPDAVHGRRSAVAPTASRPSGWVSMGCQEKGRTDV
jgi:hypothetical protein